MSRTLRFGLLSIFVVSLAASGAFAQEDPGDPPPITRMEIPAPCPDYQPCLQEKPGVVVVRPGKHRVGPPDRDIPVPAAVKEGPMADVAMTMGSGALEAGAGFSLPRSEAAARSASQEARRSLKRLIKQLG